MVRLEALVEFIRSERVLTVVELLVALVVFVVDRLRLNVSVLFVLVLVLVLVVVVSMVVSVVVLRTCPGGSDGLLPWSRRKTRLFNNKRCNALPLLLVLGEFVLEVLLVVLLELMLGALVIKVMLLLLVVVVFESVMSDLVVVLLSMWVVFVRREVAKSIVKVEVLFVRMIDVFVVLVPGAWVILVVMVMLFIPIGLEKSPPLMFVVVIVLLGTAMVTAMILLLVVVVRFLSVVIVVLVVIVVVVIVGGFPLNHLDLIVKSLLVVAVAIALTLLRGTSLPPRSIAPNSGHCASQK